MIVCSYCSSQAAEVQFSPRFGVRGSVNTKHASGRITVGGSIPGIRVDEMERDALEEYNDSVACVDNGKTLFVANLGISDRVTNCLGARRVDAVARSRGGEIPDLVQGSNVHASPRS